MLKLKTTNGKFDIVFESDPVIDDKAKLSGVRATSAGRRKNLEWKSKILPKKNLKEPNLHKVKTSKATQLRNERLAKNRLKKEKIPPKESSIPEDTVKVHSVPEHNDVKHDHREIKSDSQAQSNTPVASAGKSINRRDTFTTSATTGVISKEDLNTINRRLKEDTVEPIDIPGLSTRLTSNTTKDINDKSSPNTTLESVRQDDIRRRQCTPVEVYDPWGKPGAGAPMKSTDGGVRTHRNIGLIQSEKDGAHIDHNDKQTYQTSPLGSSRGRTTDNVVEKEDPKKHTTTGVGSRFARGQGKQQHELAELDKQRQKHLEHQQAIAAQVEEKLLKKQMEKDNKRKEEEEAETRFKKQQEQIQQRLEDEQRKEREKQEAKMLKQKMLEEGIKKAEEAAKRAKDEARKARLKPSEPTPNLSAASPQYTRVLHGDNDTIRPSQNFDDELASIDSNDHENADTTFSKPVKEVTKTKTTNSKLESKIPKPKAKKKTVTKKNEETFQRKPSPEKDVQNDTHDDYLVPLYRTKTADMYATRGSSDDGSDAESDVLLRFMNNNKEKNDSNSNIKNNKTTKQVTSHYNEEDEKEIEVVKKKSKQQKAKAFDHEVDGVPQQQTRTKLKDKKVKQSKESVNIHRTPEASSDDDEDVYHTLKKMTNGKKSKELSPRRSVDNNTTNNRSKANKKTTKKPATSPQVNHKGRRMSPFTDAQLSDHAPLASPSTKRQQEILSRLAELRAGLQQKEKECYNTTWSR